jgi:GDPmannose 4,6-dehydratase
MKTALVVGSGGQDGRLLVEKLAQDGRVVGLDVTGTTRHGFEGELPPKVLLTSSPEVDALVSRVRPDEIYYLAAHHHSAEERPNDASELRACLDVHVLGLVNVLDAVTRHVPACRVFYAGSSHMFGRPETAPQSERTPFAPKNPYAITKVAAAHTCALYRERGVHASVGILYNHESTRRGPQFVTTRIVRGARAAKKDPSFRLQLGSLSAVVDWGYAPDYVDAMTRIVAQDTPDDYVIATGEPHTVRDFAELAFRAVGLDWADYVTETAGLVKGVQATLIGDASKLRTRTGWKPTVSFEQMVNLLALAEE